MPTSQTPIEPETPLQAETPEQTAPVAADPVTVDPDAPLSFVPHPQPGEGPRVPVRIRTNRYGEMEEHELVHLLDTIEDERARGRFRESIYMSVFFWLVVAWFVFYGPRVLWHAPTLVNPADVLKQRELTELNMPVLPRNLPTPRSAAKPAPRPTLDNKTLEQLRKMTRQTPPPTPLPNAPTPAPAATAPPPPPAATPTPRPATTPLPAAPLPSAPSAAAPSTSAFSTNPGIGAPRGGRSDGGPGFVPSARAPLGGGAEILSDTQGVNFDPYLRRILSDIKRNWLPLIPEEAEPPLSKQGETFIRFTILPDGNIKSASMHLDNSSRDVAIDKSCWSAIVSEGQFPPLPAQFHGPELELRIHFLVNKNIEY